MILVAISLACPNKIKVVKLHLLNKVYPVYSFLNYE